MVAPPNRPTPAPAPDPVADDDAYMRRVFAETALRDMILEHIRVHNLTSPNEVEDYIESLLPDNPTLQNIINDEWRRLSLEGNIRRNSPSRVEVDLSRFVRRGGRKSRHYLRRKSRRMRRTRHKKNRRRTMRR
jgi:hypothetical protein